MPVPVVQEEIVQARALGQRLKTTDVVVMFCQVPKIITTTRQKQALFQSPTGKKGRAKTMPGSGGADRGHPSAAGAGGDSPSAKDHRAEARSYACTSRPGPLPPTICHRLLSRQRTIMKQVEEAVLCEHPPFFQLAAICNAGMFSC